MPVMSAAITLSIVLLTNILISQRAVIENLPVGSSCADVEQYWEDVQAKSEFITKESSPQDYPRFVWGESDIGYYDALIENVRLYWLLPSFGQVFYIRVGISNECLVTKVEVFPRTIGFP